MNCISLSVNNLLSKISFFPLLFLVATEASCSAELPEPYFFGLNPGVLVSETCTTYGDYSVKLTESDEARLFDVFHNKSCQEKPVLQLDLDIDSTLAGVWQGFVVFDEGTDVNGRSLRMVALNNPEEIYTPSFEGDAPRFTNYTLTYYSPSKDIASAKACESLGLDYQDMKNHADAVHIGYQYEFSAKTRKTTQIRNSYTCYAVQ